MARPFNVIKTRRVHVYLPEDTLARLELFLYSPGEQRVPYGSVSRFLADRIEQFFKENPDVR